MDTAKRDKRIIMILTIFTIVFTFFGASLAYWNWETAESQKTNVVFTLTQDFRCAADGGGDITQTDAFIAPAKCTNSTHAIKREVTVTPTIFRNNLTIYMELWLKVNSLDSGLKNSDNFKYAFTTSSESCTEGVISQGNLKNLNSGDTKVILSRNFSNSTPATYYLWVWLDEAETSTSTMDQSFSLTLDGACTDNQVLVVPEGGVYMVGTPEDEVNPSQMSYSMKRLATNNVCNYDNAVVYNSGDVVKVAPSTCDKYMFGDYEYIYNAHIVNQSIAIDESLEGWGVININSTNSSPGQILSTVNSKDVVSMSETFKNSSIVTAPAIPSTIKNMNSTFNGCSNLSGTIEINANPSTYLNLFTGTSNLIKIFGTSSKLDEIATSSNNVTVGSNDDGGPTLDELFVDTSHYTDMTGFNVYDVKVTSVDLTNVGCNVTYISGSGRYVQSIMVHQKIGEDFYGILTNVCKYVNESPWINEIQTAGAYVDRQNIGTDYHAMGLAIDLNNEWTYTSNGKTYRPYPDQGEWTWHVYKEFICEVCDGKEDCEYNVNYIIWKRYFEGNGWCWYGNKEGIGFDPMHYEIRVNNECDVTRTQPISCE